MWKTLSTWWSITHTWWRRLACDSWWLEYAAAVTSLASLTAIIGLLASYDGKPQFQWHSVTLNAAVSVLSTLSRGTTAFAVASCLGQFKWIWFQKRRHHLSDFDLIGQASKGPYGALQILFSKNSWYSHLNRMCLFVNTHTSQVLSRGRMLGNRSSSAF